LDRLESLAAIQQLAYRYGVAVDSRDMDMLTGLFVPDVRAGRNETGREALKRWFTTVMSGPRSTCHFVGNHVVDFDDADHARGIVYCHDELDRAGQGGWVHGQLQYWDTYRRVDGEWCFERRKFLRLYLTDWLSPPLHGEGTFGGPGSLVGEKLPEAYPSWNEFWTRVESQQSEA
jgi:hypothetical protein